MQNHGDFAAADLPHLFVGFVDQVLAVEDDVAGNDAGGRAGDKAQQRQGGHGFAAARLADDAQRFAGPQRKADAVDGFGDAPAVVEVGMQVADFQHRFAEAGAARIRSDYTHLPNGMGDMGETPAGMAIKYHRPLASVKLSGRGGAGAPLAAGPEKAA